MAGQSWAVATSVVTSYRVPNRSGDPDGGPQPDYEYILGVSRSSDGQQLAVALSNFHVKVYDRRNLAFVGELTGHSAPITQLRHSAFNPQLLYSCSEDGTVRGWDTRRQGQAFSYGSTTQELHSLAIGYDDHLCAAGGEGVVHFFDLRKSGKRLATYKDCHTDTVTQLHFHPNQPTHLVTASEDGLICLYDTGVGSEDEALLHILNAECPVRRVGFFGRGWEGLYCCTGNETLSVWHLPSAQRITDFGDVRARGQAWGVQLDYLVGCRYCEELDRLDLLAGSYAGQGFVVTVTADDLQPAAELAGGHKEQIRSFDWLGDSIVTGGEDSRLCLWTASARASPAPAERSSAPGPLRRQPDGRKQHRDRVTPY